MYEADKVVLEINGSGNQTGRNIYGTNLLMRKAGSDTLYYMYNGHADVNALIDATTGVVRASYYYDAFGNVQEQKYYTANGEETSQKINNNITYAGYQYDDETGLYYLNARMYDPKIARFLQEDTYRGDLNDSLSLNLYTYCSNNPIMYWDPTGHKAKGVVLKLGSTGTDVEIIQRLMVQYGYLQMPEGVKYGYYGELTRDAVKKFQTEANIDANGLVGDETWRKLNLYLEDVGDTNARKAANEQYRHILNLDPIYFEPVDVRKNTSSNNNETKSPIDSTQPSFRASILDPIEMAAIEDARKELDAIINYYYAFEWPTAYKIEDFSWLREYNHKYDEAVELNLRVGALTKIIDYISTVKDAFEEVSAVTGGEPSSTMVGTFAYSMMDSAWSQEPGIGDYPEFLGINSALKRGISKSKLRANFVEDSCYKYLIAVDRFLWREGPRQKFIKEINKLISTYDNNIKGPYDNPQDNEKYKMAVLGYWEKVKYINENYDESVAKMKEALKVIDMLYGNLPLGDE